MPWMPLAPPLISAAVENGDPREPAAAVDPNPIVEPGRHDSGHVIAVVVRPHRGEGGCDEIEVLVGGKADVEDGDVHRGRGRVRCTISLKFHAAGKRISFWPQLPSVLPACAEPGPSPQSHRYVVDPSRPHHWTAWARGPSNGDVQRRGLHDRFPAE